MPKLNYPKITKGEAIGTLLKIYMEDPKFMTEWEALRHPYISLIQRAAKDLLFFERKTGMSFQEYYDALDEYYKNDGPDPFPADKFKYISKLQPYFDSLAKLAEKWKLRARWSVAGLYFLELMGLLGITPDTQVDVPFDEFQSIVPYKPPLPPFELRISAWAFIMGGRERILDEVAARLKTYEVELKSKGLKEYPSSVEYHARLWFEHYVHGKKYPDLEKEYPPANAESIKKAVWKFGKLVGIKIG